MTPTERIIRSFWCSGINVWDKLKNEILFAFLSRTTVPLRRGRRTWRRSCPRLRNWWSRARGTRKAILQPSVTIRRSALDCPATRMVKMHRWTTNSWVGLSVSGCLDPSDLTGILSRLWFWLHLKLLLIHVLCNYDSTEVGWLLLGWLSMCKLAKLSL